MFSKRGALGPHNLGKMPKREVKECGREELFSQLQNTISLRIEEHQTFLNFFFYSIATNALLFIALFEDGDIPKHPIVGVVISSLGIIATVVLTLLQSRVLLHMRAHEKFIKKLEGDLELGEYAYTENLNRLLDESISNPRGIIQRLYSLLPNYPGERRGKARRLMELFNFFCVTVWTISLASFTVWMILYYL